MNSAYDLPVGIFLDADQALTPTKRKLVRWGAIFFLEQGFANARTRDIADAAGVSLGSYTRYFPTKEDLLLELVKQVAAVEAAYVAGLGASSAAHATNAANTTDAAHDTALPVYAPEVSFGLEIGALLTLCTEQARIRELYCMAYSLPKTLDYIRKFSWKKTQALLGALLPDWTERMYYKAEVLATGMVFGSIMAPIGPLYPLQEKIDYTLDKVLSLYNLDSDVREGIREQVRKADLLTFATEMMDQLIEGIGAVRDEHEDSSHRTTRSARALSGGKRAATTHKGAAHSAVTNKPADEMYA